MGDIRIGFVTQTHTGAVSYWQAIEDAADAEFDFVEIYLDGASERHDVDPVEVVELCDEGDLDVLVHLPFVDLDLGTPRERIREASIDEQRACIRAAAEMGAEKAVLHASTHATPPEWSRDEVMPNVLESIRVLDAYGADRHVQICVENLPGVLPTIHDFEPIFAETDAAMTLDTGHARLDGYDEQDVAAFLVAHRDRVSHVHVNDSRAAADEHVPTGSGTQEFAVSLAPLVESDWEGTISIEAYTFDFDYIDLSKRKLLACLDDV
jgi:sugar phosphate isomerase/epimerase